MLTLYIPFALQSVAMLFDEFYFHEKRGLPKWERVGHPIDTFSVFLSYSFLFFYPYTQTNLKTYILIAAISCLFITKDEFVHTKLCPPLESWLHSMMFILHPLSFLCSAIIWINNSNNLLLYLQTIIVLIFMLYQILRWNIKWNFLKPQL